MSNASKKKQHYGQHDYEVQTNYYLRRTNKPANYMDLKYKSITKCCFNGGRCKYQINMSHCNPHF